MVTLNESVRLVLVRFGVSNPDSIPPSLKFLYRDCSEKQKVKHDGPNGSIVIGPIDRCSLTEFPWQIEEATYELVNASYKRRVGMTPRNEAHFTFVRWELADVSDEFKRTRDSVRDALRIMCNDAMWRALVFSNPFYKEGKEVPGQRALSINLAARQPFFQPNGQLVTAWAKDKDGERVGVAPVPIQPSCYLRVVDNTLQIVAA